MIQKIVKSGIFWTFIFGIIGILFTVLFYEFGKKEREPVYFVKKEPSLIFDKNNSSPKIKLITVDSIPINNNVYVTSIVIWNNGELEINKSDIRKKISVSFSNAQILDYKIIKETNPGISNFTVIQKNKKLIIDWDFFDPKFGFELQIIYSGSENSRLLVDGYVLGNNITKYKDNSIKFRIILILIISILYNFLIDVFIKYFPDNKYSKLIVSVILVIFYAVAISFGLNLLEPNIPL